MSDEENAFMKAKQYDTMIQWDQRLKREIPFLNRNLPVGKLFDIACSSGRHSFALEKLGYSPFGIDISEAFIQIANELKEENRSKANFAVVDATLENISNELRIHSFPLSYDSAILLGNAIANMQSLSNGTRLLVNTFNLIRPGGIFILQTINRPLSAHYIPMRELQKENNSFIVQRIAIPVSNFEHNLELNVNVIDAQNCEYESQSRSEMYWYTAAEFESLVTKIGWKILDKNGGYQDEDFSDEGGKTVIWVLQKPEIKFCEEALELFSKYSSFDDTSLIHSKIIKVWGKAKEVHSYRCIEEFRFQHPRISSYPFISEIITDLEKKTVADVGCALGTDLRYLITKGLLPENAIGIDITSKFIELGFELYDVQPFDPKFYSGDITNILVNSGQLQRVYPEKLGELVELESFQNRFDIIFASSVLHLLEKTVVQQFMKSVRQMLLPGGCFVGRVVGGQEEEYLSLSSGLRTIFTSESLNRFLSESGFTKIEIINKKVERLKRMTDTESYGTLMFQAYCQ
jgi:SAM-dependent methyltransferase